MRSAAGRRIPEAVVPQGTAYSELSRRIKQAGLLDRRPGDYTGRIAATVVACAAGVAGFLLVGDSWWQTAVAVYFAVISTQLGFLGHDAGHRQIFRSGRANYILGVVLANIGVGFSYGWWVDKQTQPPPRPPQRRGARPRRRRGRPGVHHWTGRSERTRRPLLPPLPGMGILPATTAGSAEPEGRQRAIPYQGPHPVPAP